MDPTTMVAPNITEGSTLLSALLEEGFGLTYAAWIRDDDSGAWRLVIALEEVDRLGTRSAYTQLLGLLERRGIQLRLDDIVAVGSASKASQYAKDRRAREDGESSAAAGPTPLTLVVRSYDIEMLKFERALAAAISGAIERLNDRTLLLVRVAGSDEEVDFIIHRQRVPSVAIEAKVRPRPLGSVDLAKAFRAALYYPALLVVSRSGFTERALATWKTSEAHTSRSALGLVRWEPGGEFDADLNAELGRLLEIVERRGTEGPNQRIVEPREGGRWAIKKPHSRRASAVAGSQQEAVELGRVMLERAGGGVLVVHDRTGAAVSVVDVDARPVVQADQWMDVPAEEMPQEEASWWRGQRT
jgi:hypothetical protein